MPTPEPDCAEMELLLQADLDGELDAASIIAVSNHIAHCEHCASLQKNLLRLREMLGNDLLRAKPSAEFGAALREKLTPQPLASLRVFEPRRKPSSAFKNIGLFGAGAALAASLLLTLAPSGLFSQANPLLDSVIAEHVQSLQAEHLLDVVSSDRHTVKPWFNGKLDFTPPVADFAADGFALAGGRLAYLDNRSVAALVYRHGAHPLNVFVWPDSTQDAAPDCSQKSGYNVCAWRKDGMAYWAVSDMAQDEMQKFVALMR